jgi:hypothetical protein
MAKTDAAILARRSQEFVKAGDGQGDLATACSLEQAIHFASQALCATAFLGLLRGDIEYGQSIVVE